MQNKKNIKAKGILLRLAEIEDAKFILKLRTDSKLNKFISYTDNNILQQIDWLKNYKNRELKESEYYFIIENENKEKFGTYRIYNLEKKSFTIGSWLCEHNAPQNIAIKADILCKDFGFNVLNFDICKFDVRKKNKKVIQYHKLFNPELIGEDDLNYYYKLDKNKFNKQFVSSFFGIKL